MRIYCGNLYITEVCREGVELNYEFECAHSESSEYFLEFLINHYSSLNLSFINFYYDALIDNYLVNVKNVNDKRINEAFDLSLLSNLNLDVFEKDLKIVF